MSSEYTNDLLVLVHENNFDIANHLAAAIGESVADLETFTTPVYEKGVDKFMIIIARIKPVVLTKANNPLVRPDFDSGNEIDMVKAEQARNLITWDFSDINNNISCQLNTDIQSVLDQTGLSYIEFEIV